MTGRHGEASSTINSTIWGIVSFSTVQKTKTEAHTFKD
jgi:hypothetical protein